MKKIYISPSTQYNNLYFDKIHNEMQMMEMVGKLLVARLAKYEVQAIMRTRAERLADARPSDAAALKCDYYIELHTNAGGGLGCETYYQVGIDKPSVVVQASKAFALKVNDAISTLTTSNPRAGDRGIKARTQRDGRDANGELRNCSMPAILCEIEFHDTQFGCNWILMHTSEIADALCKAIVAQMGLVLKPIPVPPKPIAYYPIPRYNGTSIVDALKAAGVRYYLGLGSRIALKNGIVPYVGTAAQNSKMLTLLKDGKLKKV